MKLKNLCLGNLGFVALTVMSISSCFSSPPQVLDNTSKPLTSIDVCHSASTASTTAIWYAYEKGIFSKYGLDVKLISVKGGSEAALAMISGKADICQVAGTAIANAAISGADLVMIGGLINSFNYELVVTPDIQTPSDLKGKALAISKVGSSSDLFVRIVLRHFNLQPDKDVAIVSIGEDNNRLLAMESGKIAGTVTSPPNIFRAKQKGYRFLLDTFSANLPYQHTGIATSRSYIKQNRLIVLNFMKATVESIALMKKDREGTLEVIAKYNKLNRQTDAVLLNEIYDSLVIKNLDRVPYPTLPGMQTILTNIKYDRPEAINVKPEETVDISLLKELEDSGFVRGLYK